MNRKDAEDLSVRIATALVAAEGDKKVYAGVRMAAIMCADTVARNGAIEGGTFLKMCGLHPEKKRKTFRGTEYPGPMARMESAIVEGRWPFAEHRPAGPSGSPSE